MTRRVLVAGLLVLVSRAIGAQGAAPDPARFAAEIKAFAAWDAKNAAPAGGVLFAGSSSIRLWSTAADFPDLPVINRGFGGSLIPDVNHFIAETVLKYAPDVVVFYAGDNDINSGRSAAQVLDDYRAFVTRVRKAKASTQIIFLAIKPSVARWKHWPIMQEANNRIRDYSAGYSSGPGGGPLHFVDVATPMLGPGGTMPSASLFVADGLHMTAAGYAIWTKALGPVLRDVARRATAGR
jgi:lysophospholipase L1-like esterase